MASTVPTLLTVEQAAAALGCSPRWLADQLRAGRFRARKIGRKWMLTGDDLDDIVRECAVPPKVAATAISSSEAPQGSSMTRTTARRVRRASKRSPG
ncbi:helix-turn-helix domain-containing protein [Mycolicibacterium sp. XJ2]